MRPKADSLGPQPPPTCGLKGRESRAAPTTTATSLAALQAAVRDRLLSPGHRPLAEALGSNLPAFQAARRGAAPLMRADTAFVSGKVARGRRHHPPGMAATAWRAAPFAGHECPGYQQRRLKTASSPVHGAPLIARRFIAGRTRRGADDPRRGVSHPPPPNTPSRHHGSHPRRGAQDLRRGVGLSRRGADHPRRGVGHPTPPVIICAAAQVVYAAAWVAHALARVPHATAWERPVPARNTAARAGGAAVGFAVGRRPTWLEGRAFGPFYLKAGETPALPGGVHGKAGESRTLRPPPGLR